MKVLLTSIQRDESLQMRVKPIRRATVREYAEAMKAGAIFPAVVLFVDDQGRHWPGDGWHRIEATDSLALPEIEADVRPGGWRAAFLYALQANDEHGLRRTVDDRTKAIEAALGDEELRQLSDREIARRVRVDHKTVGKVRTRLQGGGTLGLMDAFRKGGDGKVRRTSRVCRVGISPVGENGAPGSAPGGAGGGFNVVKESQALEAGLLREFRRWPKEKRRTLCVLLYNLAKENDPEIGQMTIDAFAEVLERRDDEQQ